jgi:hypothetical protein
MPRSICLTLYKARDGGKVQPLASLRKTISFFLYLPRSKCLKFSSREEGPTAARISPFPPPNNPVFSVSSSPLFSHPSTSIYISSCLPSLLPPPQPLQKLTYLLLRQTYTYIRHTYGISHPAPRHILPHLNPQTQFLAVPDIVTRTCIFLSHLSHIAPRTIRNVLHVHLKFRKSYGKDRALLHRGLFLGTAEEGI